MFSFQKIITIKNHITVRCGVEKTTKKKKTHTHTHTQIKQKYKKKKTKTKQVLKKYWKQGKRKHKRNKRRSIDAVAVFW